MATVKEYKPQETVPVTCIPSGEGFKNGNTIYMRVSLAGEVVQDRVNAIDMENGHQVRFDIEQHVRPIDLKIEWKYK